MTPTPTPTKGIHPGYGVFSAGVLLAQAGPEPPRCKSWTYTLTVYQTYPSRMVMVKNALGGSVAMITAWQPPLVWPTLTATWAAGTSTGPATQDIAPTNPTDVWQHTYSWTVTFDDFEVDPGPPFNLYNNPDPAASPRPALPADGTKWTYRDLSNVASDAYTNVGNVLIFDALGNPFGVGAEYLKPVDLIQVTASLVNWGMMIFSTGLDKPLDPSTGDPTVMTQIIQTIDTADTNNVTAIETALQLFNGGSGGGLNAYGSTPTKWPSISPKRCCRTRPRGRSSRHGVLKDDLGNEFNLPPDPKIDCNRQFGSILVTDGTSNIGNPGGCTGTNFPVAVGGNWAEPGWTCGACAVDSSGALLNFNAGQGCPDGGPSGSLCPITTSSSLARRRPRWRIRPASPTQPVGPGTSAPTPG